MAEIYREVTTFTTVAGAEIAQIGWHWDTAASPADLKEAIDDHFPTLWTGWKPNQVNNLTVSERELQIRDLATGALVGTLPLDVPSPAAGTAEQFPLPPQCAAVMSLRSDTPGPSGRGRFYMAGLGNTMLTSLGRLTDAIRNDLVTDYVTYVNAVSAEILDLSLNVYSKTHGTSYQVTKIDMGNVIDTQRRRRSELVESRYSVVI